MGGKVDRIVSWMEDVKEEFKKQKNKWKEMIEEMRRDFKTQGKGWEREREKMEREKRRRNIIIKGMKAKEGKRREAVEEILEVIGAKVEIKEVRRIGEITEKGRGEMMLVKLESEDQK